MRLKDKVAYAAKAGVAGLTRTMAMELAPEVTMNCIAPALIRTRVLDRPDPSLIAPWRDRTLLNRLGEPEASRTLRSSSPAMRRPSSPVSICRCRAASGLRSDMENDAMDDHLLIEEGEGLMEVVLNRPSEHKLRVDRFLEKQAAKRQARRDAPKREGGA